MSKIIGQDAIMTCRDLGQEMVLSDSDQWAVQVLQRCNDDILRTLLSCCDLNPSIAVVSTCTIES